MATDTQAKLLSNFQMNLIIGCLVIIVAHVQLLVFSVVSLILLFMLLYLFVFWFLLLVL